MGKGPVEAQGLGERRRRAREFARNSRDVLQVEIGTGPDCSDLLADGTYGVRSRFR